MYNHNDMFTYFRDGYFHEETRRYMRLPIKFIDLINIKASKFYNKYGIKQFPFTYGIDDKNDIEVITILHPKFDIFSEKNGESIVLGRFKRFYGGIQWSKKRRLFDDRGNEVFHTKKEFRFNKKGKPILNKKNEHLYKIVKIFEYYTRNKNWNSYKEIPKFINVPNPLT